MKPAPLRTTLLSAAARNSTVVENDFSNSGAGPRILTAELLDSSPEEDRYRIVCVADGREAFRILKRDANFDAAIFNLTIPHLPGVDLVKHMKTEKRLMRIPVALVSDERGLRAVGDGFAAGAVTFLAKPFGSEQLKRMVQLALNSCGRSIEVRRAA